MIHEQDSPDSEIEVKKPATLDSIPEDVSMSIIQEIRSWAEEVEGDSDEREKARKTRDSTLRAAALTSRKSLQVYLPALLRNVTLLVYHLPSFIQMMSRDEIHQFGRLVQSLHVKSFYMANDVHAQKAYKEAIPFLVANSDLLQMYGKSEATYDKEKLKIGILQGVQSVAQTVYDKLKNLEVLILEDSTLMFSFQFRAEEKLVCHQFLMNSLKKLYIARLGLDAFEPCNLSAINSIWLLLFVPHLKEAALCFSATIRDFDLLVELSESFQGLSRVEKLALEITFISKGTDRRTWWTRSGENSKGYLGGNRATEALHRILSVTKGLQALEISNGSANFTSNPQEDTQPALSCLSSLYKSFGTMKHLRLIRFGCYGDPISRPDFVSFKSLTLLSVDFYLIASLRFLPSVLFPPSLETVSSTFYERPTEDLLRKARLTQDGILIDVIKVRSLPRLNQVVVPLQHIKIDGKRIEDPIEDLNVWTRSRERFRNHELFASGVRLREVLPGERIGDDSEVFLSTRRWLSP